MSFGGAVLSNEPAASVAEWQDAMWSQCKDVKRDLVQSPSRALAKDQLLVVCASFVSLSQSIMQVPVSDVRLLPTPSLLLRGCDTSSLPPSALSDYDASVFEDNTFHVSGENADVTWTHQGEYGFVVAPRGRRVSIASTDATSCIIVAARGWWVQPDGRDAGGPAAVCMCHFDSPHPTTLTTLDDMIRRMLVPALCVACDPAASIVVEWYVVGGIHRDPYSVPVLADIAFFLAALLPATVDVPSAGGVQAASVNVLHRLCPGGLCFDSMNSCQEDETDRLRCCVWGLIVDVSSGECSPCCMEVGSRNYPAAALRDTQCGRYRPISLLHPPRLGLPAPFSQPVSRVVLSPAQDVAAKLLKMAYSDQEHQQPVELTFSSFVRMMLDRAAVAGSRLPVVVSNTRWSRQQRPSPTAASDADYLTMSTTPSCEPPDFPFVMRRRALFCIMTDPDDVYGGLRDVGLLC